MAEAEVEDVPYPDKTEESEEAEMFAFSLIRNELFGKHEDFVLMPIDHGNMNLIHKQFWHCVEHLGYALYADRRLQEGRGDFFLVVEKSVIELLRYRGMFVSVKEALRQLEGVL
jgi:hypothetical protein